ncbi:MAG: glycosyltransferase family 39 protein, partial [Candidatus Omnitrophica bacterium]|nr:glycosyltransferase family 39 protein [Candidatus Omnitrophota bacterium]
KKAGIFIIIAIFLTLSLPYIYNPGLNIDEADKAITCDIMFKNTLTVPQDVLAGYHITLFNRFVPTMASPYSGRIHVYLMYIFSRLFGVNVFSLRLSSIVVSAFTLYFIYLLCKMWFGYRVAAITVLLTATNLFFVQYARLGYYREVVFILFFFWAGFFLISKYLRERKLYLLCLSFFLFGLGLTTKITMLFYLASLAISFMLLNRKFKLLLGVNIKHASLALLSFCAGSFYLILFNIREGWMTVKLLLNALMRPSPGYNNLAYLYNLRERIKHLMELLGGNISERFEWGVTEGHFMESIAPVLVALFFISFIFVFLYMFFLKGKIEKHKIMFFFIFYITVFFLTPFTIGGSNPGHLLLLLPFPQLVVALSIDYIWMKSKDERMAFGVASLLLAPFLVFHVATNIHFHKEMKRNGGYRRCSTAIYGLTDYLIEKGIYSPVTFGWGLHHNIAFLSKYKVVPNQLDENYSLEYIEREYRRLSLKNEPIFFLTKGSEDCMPNLNLFMRLAEKDGRNKEPHKVFYNHAGEPVYWLYKIY